MTWTRAASIVVGVLSLLGVLETKPLMAMESLEALAVYMPDDEDTKTASLHAQLLSNGMGREQFLLLEDEKRHEILEDFEESYYKNRETFKEQAVQDLEDMKQGDYEALSPKHKSIARALALELLELNEAPQRTRVMLMLKAGVDPYETSDLFDVYNERGHSILTLAIHQGHYDLANVILNEVPPRIFDPNSPQRMAQRVSITPLIATLERGFSELHEQTHRGTEEFQFEEVDALFKRLILMGFPLHDIEGVGPQRQRRTLFEGLVNGVNEMFPEIERFGHESYQELAARLTRASKRQLAVADEFEGVEGSDTLKRRSEAMLGYARLLESLLDPGLRRESPSTPQALRHIQVTSEFPGSGHAVEELLCKDLAVRVNLN